MVTFHRVILLLSTFACFDKFQPSEKHWRDNNLLFVMNPAISAFDLSHSSFSRHRERWGEKRQD
jgi:hypothetical protein